MTKQTKPRRPYVKKVKPTEPDKFQTEIQAEIKEVVKKFDIPSTVTEKFTVNPTNRYEPHILKLLKIEGFYDLWISRIPHTRTHEEAYESAETFFEACYSQHRFASYESFRSSVSQWQAKRREGLK